MSDAFRPLAARQLAEWAFSGLETDDCLFGIPRGDIYVPPADSRLRSSVFGHALGTPFGPAAGPHTQMAQNIVAAWLCGARYVELKTVQTLDRLDVSKPCIDMEDEGYNVEWSQELEVHQSFDEYLRAWVVIHALHRRLGFPGDSPDVVFNLSVGYDLDGIRAPNVQWFLDQMRDCSAYKQYVVDEVGAFCPEVRDLDIPDCISDNVTLSTMHGCPPGEIERICTYLLRERRLHTLVKLNPTLLGPERVRALLNEDLGFTDVTAPDAAFEHDLDFADAVPMLRSLRAVGDSAGLVFGVKLSNTLEVENHRHVFGAAEKTMYLSGRPLHVITVNLAHLLAEEFEGDLPMSFSAGASCFNAPSLLAAGMRTVTTCSDLLKTGGYLRLLQYLDHTEEVFDQTHSGSIEELVHRAAGMPLELADTPSVARLNLRRYAEAVRTDRQYLEGTFLTSGTKTSRALGLFDCIEAPCADECPLGQKVPAYMRAVRDGDLDGALRIVHADNPIPGILGRVCDHLCEHTCVRTHLDEPLAIRDVKRFITERAARQPSAAPAARPGGKVAVVGAGPGGMAAALELAREGLRVEVFEARPYAGGMVGGAVPEYRLPGAVLERDLEQLRELGVEIHFDTEAGRDFSLAELRRDGFDHVAIMVGAQRSKTLGLEGEECDGVVDALRFLRDAREGRAIELGRRVGVIGAGDTAMDCARVAQRLSGTRVTLIYRRTTDQMPADREEIAHLLEEEVRVLELAKPQRLVVEDGRLRGLVCQRMTYAGERDASGRKIPVERPGSDFEVPIDTLILAISQHAVLDFLEGEPIVVNDRGYIEVDPVTFETSSPGIYAGGDVVNDGPASIVQAAAAGRAIADSILGRRPSKEAASAESCDQGQMVRRRSLREWRLRAPEISLAEREGFDEVVLTYDDEQARAEAARCLDCDTYCSLCVGVCPNLAIQTYRSDPLDVRLPELRLAGDGVQIDPGGRFRVTQRYQVAVLTDLCNECGNCTTFCPTAGSPYRDKPRLYADRAAFEGEQDNAFIVERDEDGWTMDARWQGATHRIELGETLAYTSPHFRVRLDAETFEVERAEPTSEAREADTLSLETCARMYVLLRGLARSMPFLPCSSAGGAAQAGRIARPEYGSD